MTINYLLSHKKLILTLILVGVAGFILGQSVNFNHVSPTLKLSKAPGVNLVNSQSDNETYYTCPMHPEIISDSPGTCPVCGMDLVKQHHIHPQNNRASAYPAITISPVVVHNLGIRTARAQRGVMQHNIETIGKITRIDLTARRIITPPFGGVISYIADKYDGDEVTEGELLFAMTSPTLQEQQLQFQGLLKQDNSLGVSLIKAQLISAGLTSEQISKLQSGHPANFSVEIYAKEAGYIFSRRGDVGDSIPSGFTVFNIGSNYQVVEVTAEIFERQWNWVKVGQQANMVVRGLPGVSFSGKVVRVEPPVGYTTRSLEISLKFKTDHPGLSQSMFAHISIIGQSRHNILMVPRDTVIKTEQQDRVVLLKDNGQYQPVTVIAGEESGGMVEILSGLKNNDTVVSSGQFLIDSESNLQSAFQRMSIDHPDGNR
ncbi:MAG: efflux RND transporter periplasmic adaptor subunit [Methylococcales bacterium]